MSTLGLSGPPQPTDGVLKGLFWPTIQNAQDADLAASRGFWICLGITFLSVTLTDGTTTLSVGFSIDSLLSLTLLLFYFLGSVGVRRASLTASASMLMAYLLSTAAYLWLTPLHFSFIRFVVLGLLVTTMRAALLIRAWRKDPARKEELHDLDMSREGSWVDSLRDVMPREVWPIGRFIFYILAAGVIPLEFLQLLSIITRHH